MTRPTAIRIDETGTHEFATVGKPGVRVYIRKRGGEVLVMDGDGPNPLAQVGGLASFALNLGAGDYVMAKRYDSHHRVLYLGLVDTAEAAQDAPQAPPGTAAESVPAPPVDGPQNALQEATQ